MQDTQSKDKGSAETDRAMQCFLTGAQIGDDVDSIAVAVHEFYENEFNRVGTAAEQWLKLLVSRVEFLQNACELSFISLCRAFWLEMHPAFVILVCVQKARSLADEYGRDFFPSLLFRLTDLLNFRSVHLNLTPPDLRNMRSSGR